MKTTISNVYQFRDEFAACGRKDNFSYEGLGALWDYLEQWELDTGEDLECDVIAFCCEFSEDTWRDIARSYDIILDPENDDYDNQQKVAEWLHNEGAFVGHVGDCFVYRNI